MFAQTLCPVGTMRIRFFDYDRLNRRNVSDRGNEVVMQIFGPAGDVFFHKGHPQTLREIARDRGVPVETVIAEVEAALAALRADGAGE